MLYGLYMKNKCASETVQKLKLNKEAERYFVTICHRLLTKAGSRDGVDKYVKFRIYGNHFFALLIDEQTGKENMLMSARFEGNIIVNQDPKGISSSKNFSYGEFEILLRQRLKGLFVYDRYVQHQWKKLVSNKPQTRN
jgi:hypothetical protein